MGTSLTASGVQFPDNSVQTAPALTGFRNKIINGDMKISQRGTSFVAVASNNHTLDRFVYYAGSTAVVNIVQSNDYPASSGLVNSLMLTVTTADTSIAAGDLSVLGHHIEGYNITDLINTPFTISFWIKSSKVGTHCFRLSNAGDTRSYVVEYNITAANTWEKKSFTISSGIPFSNGTWNFTNGRGLQILWALANGLNGQTTTPNNWLNGNYFSTPNQVNCLDTVGNIFAITGVQVEKGSSATDFEQRPYGLELSLCQRYYFQEYARAEGYSSGGGALKSMIYYKQTMRGTPTLTAIGTASTNNVSSSYFQEISSNQAAFMAVISSTGAGFSNLLYSASAEL